MVGYPSPRYGSERKACLSEFLGLRNGIPSHDTFNRIFSRIDPEQFIGCFLPWVKAERSGYDGLSKKGIGAYEAYAR